MSEADSSIRDDFLVEAGEIVERLGEQLVELEQRPGDRELLNAIFRGFHTVKGGAGFLNITALVEVCHAAEEVFDALRAGKRALDAPLMDAVMKSVDAVAEMMGAVREGREPPSAPAALVAALKGAPAADEITEAEFDALLDQLHGKNGAVATPPASAVPPPRPAAPEPRASPKPAPAADTSVRVDTARLDKIMNLVGELVLVRNRLKTLRSRARDEELEKALSSLDVVTSGLQGSVMQVRMQKVARLFSRFPKLARDVARTLGKQVELKLEGEDTDLDKNLVEALADPLVHLVRNAIDHGIEKPEARAQRGKPAAGTLTLSAQQEGDQILIRIRDDGAGMDPEVIRRKAVEKGAISAEAASRLTARECLELIFLPGFSTKSEVSDLSGRGVGMDVVKSAIQALHGGVSIEAQPGHGTAILIRVPLTLAILPTLMIRVGGRLYALALTTVLDIFNLDESRLYNLDGLEVLAMADSNLPLFDLRRWMEIAEPAANPLVIVAQVEGARQGFLVDEVLGREEVVIKPLGAGLQGLPGFAGATVTGDGCIALILDLPGLLQSRVKTFAAPPKQF